jgi:hypothetical protein
MLLFKYPPPKKKAGFLKKNGKNVLVASPFSSIKKD